MKINLLLSIVLLTFSQVLSYSTEIKKIEINNLQYDIAIQSRINSDHLIVFIPGLCCTKESFEEAFESQQLKDFSLLSIDLPGCGDSSRSEKYSYSMQEQAQVIVEIIKQFKHKKLTLVGHSMGGALALLVADKFQDTLTEFVNVEGNLVGEHCHLSRKATSVSYDEFKDNIFKELCSNLENSNDKILKLWLSWINKSTSDCFYKSSDSLVKLSENPELLQKYLDLKVKKIYLLGANSYNKDVQIPNVTPVIFSDCGHFIINDNSKLFYETLNYLIKLHEK